LDVSLHEIDKTNRDACIALSVTESQTKQIAPNSGSLAWADENPHSVALGIYAFEGLVGSTLYEPRGNDVYSVRVERQLLTALLKLASSFP